MFPLLQPKCVREFVSQKWPAKMKWKQDDRTEEPKCPYRQRADQREAPTSLRALEAQHCGRAPRYDHSLPFRPVPDLLLHIRPADDSVVFDRLRRITSAPSNEAKC